MDNKNLEKEFISLLIKNKDLVEDWLDSGLTVDFFSEENRYILNAIIESFYNDVRLTLKSYKYYIEKYIPNKLERQSQEYLYNSINALNVKRDDYPTIREQIKEKYIRQKIVSSISDYQKSIDKDSVIFSAKKLLDNVSEVVDSTSSTKIKNIYENVKDYHDQYYDKLIEKRESEDEEGWFKTHIKELDETMCVGLAPGTLTLFCGDVGGYKCGYYKNKQQISNGELLTLEEIHKRINNGEEIHIGQYNENTKKITNKKILSSHFSGIKECFKIITKSGFDISSTLDHRHYTFDGYKKTADLQIGDYIAIRRKSDFGKLKVNQFEAMFIGFLLSEGGTTSGCTFTNNDPEIVKAMKLSCEKLGLKLSNRYNNNVKLKGQYGISKSKDLLYKYNLKGKKAVEKEIPSEVYTWNKCSVANMLSAMYSGDGSICIDKHTKEGKVKYSILYHTSSEELAKGVRDLLLRFSIVAKVKKYNSYYKDKNNQKIDCGNTWRVVISDTASVGVFIKEIGFIGNKQNIAKNNLSKIISKISNPNNDIIPPSIWNIINSKLKEQNKTITGCRRFYRRGVHDYWKDDLGHCGNKNKSISRKTLNKIAEYLNNDEELLSIANSDIYWDKIDSIESIGMQKTYDLCMPDYHNFISNNIVTHNSTMMLNVGLNAWEKSGANVLYVPLEMPREKMYQKLLSRQTKIEFDKLEHPKLLNNDELQIVKGYKENLQGIEDKLGSKFFIMESSEQIPVSVIRKEIEKHIDIFKPNVVIIDYIANLVADESTYRKDRNDLEIGNMLKSLRTMGKPGAIHEEGFAVVSGAQLGREGLKRIRRQGLSKGAFHSEDIRGSHEYSADSDVIYAQMEDPQQPGQRLFVFCVKARYGKKQFSTGSNKAILNLKPEIGLIYSSEDMLFSNNHDEILKKVNEAESLNFDDDDDDDKDHDFSLEDDGEVFDKILGL